MALRMAVWLVACLCAAAQLRGGEEYPYIAYVNAANVYVRSGPGENYYPVLKLPRGRKVEVYRHDPGGWYAIRPPRECFSWVSGEFIEPIGGKLARVTGERVVARVGSKFSDIRDVIQVRLDRGEEVEVLEAKRVHSDGEAQTWYKISPPAGEFRWVSGRFVDRDPPSGPRHAAGPRNNRLLAANTDDDDFDGDDFDGDDFDGDDFDGDEIDDDDGRDDDENEEPDFELADGSETDDAEAAIYETDMDEGDDFSAIDAVPAGHEVRVPHGQPRRAARDDDAIAPSAAQRAPAVEHSRRWLRDGNAANSEEELEELELALASILSDEPSRWNFNPLAHRAQAALDRAETALDRGRLRRFMRKVSEYGDLQRRHLLAIGHGESAGPPNRIGGAPRAVAHDDARSRFDGVGRLTQVATRDWRSPRYALLDERGQVACYVTPTPGVNLRRYLNQQVGVNGTLGFLSEQGATHVTARRVVSVDGPMLR